MSAGLNSVFSSLTLLDWAIVAAYLLISLFVGVYFTRRASSSMASYFVSGRDLTWWLLGTSMVATTFAADTPLAVTGWIRTDGIWKNWFWWNYIFSHVFIALVFARLWRRANVITDNELNEIRYSGKPAAFLRGFKAFYYSTLFNFIVMGWVISAMAKVLKVFFGVETTVAIAICLFIAFFYTMMSGLWGVMLTDFFQYFLALAGTIILAWVVIGSPEIGGLSGFVEKLGTIDEKHVAFFMTPSGGDPVSEGFWSSSFFTFFIYLTVIWWSSHNTDGGGYFIQRMLSAKSERDSVFGTAWFAINHYIIRFWPWVLVALASLIIYPTAEVAKGDNEAMYVVMINEYLGPGLKGILFVTFLAAFMSTLSTHLKLGRFVYHERSLQAISLQGRDREALCYGFASLHARPHDTRGLLRHAYKQHRQGLDLPLGDERGNRARAGAEMVLVEGERVDGDFRPCVVPHRDFHTRPLYQIAGHPARA